MIFLKTEDEIELMRAANLLVADTLTEIAKNIRPGVTTKQLDALAEEFIRDHGAMPTFKGFPNPYGGPFPASICTSVNDEVVHGVPNDRPLEEGDIVSVDCGTLLDGYNGDSCYTFCVGEVSEEVKRLLKVTKESLYLGIEAALAGRESVISVMPCKIIVNPMAMEWSESLSGMVSGKRCMKNRQFPITAEEVMAR